MVFARENVLALLIKGVPFVPFVALVIPLWMLYQRTELCATQTGLILDYQLIAAPFNVGRLDHGRER